MAIPRSLSVGNYQPMGKESVPQLPFVDFTEDEFDFEELNQLLVRCRKCRTNRKRRPSLAFRRKLDLNHTTDETHAFENWFAKPLSAQPESTSKNPKSLGLGTKLSL